MKLLRKENNENILLDYDIKPCPVDFDDLQKFDCGNDSLNKYMMECVKGNHAAVHGLYHINKDSKKLAGICLLKCSAYIEKIRLNFDDYGDIQEDNPMDCNLFPAIEILYFAVDKEYQDLKLADEDMDGCLASYYIDMIMALIYESSETFSKVDYILLYSVDTANSFYEKAGFTEFDENALAFKNEKQYICTPMYYAF